MGFSTIEIVMFITMIFVRKTVSIQTRVLSVRETQINSGLVELSGRFVY